MTAAVKIDSTAMLRKTETWVQSSSDLNMSKNLVRGVGSAGRFAVALEVVEVKGPRGIDDWVAGVARSVGAQVDGPEGGIALFKPQDDVVIDVAIGPERQVEDRVGLVGGPTVNNEPGRIAVPQIIEDDSALRMIIFPGEGANGGRIGKALFQKSI